MSELDSFYEYPALTPVRGVVLGRDRRGNAVDLTALRQALRLNVARYRTPKVDFWDPAPAGERVLALLEEAKHLGVRLSLATVASAPVEGVKAWAQAGLLDVCVSGMAADGAALGKWVEASGAAGLPLRVRLHGGLWGADGRDDVLGAVLARAAVVTVHFGGGCPWEAGLAGSFDRDCLDRAMASVGRLAGATCGKEDTGGTAAPRSSCQSLVKESGGALPGPEVHLEDVPFCQVPESLWPVVMQGAQRLAYHQHYHPDALAFARKLAPLPARRMQQAVEIALSEGASFHNAIDNALLPWILDQRRGLFWIWLAHKVSRRFRFRRRATEPLPEDTSTLEQRLAEFRETQGRTLGPVCAACCLRAICDHHSEVFKQAFPGVPVKAIPGAPEYDPLAFRAGAAACFDVIDAERRGLTERRQALAAEALRTLDGVAPTREIPAESYAIEDHFTDRMPASVRWFSFSTGELQSTILTRLSPPFTLSVTFGGGIAERAGFSFGRHARVLCPMTAYSHKIALHVGVDGAYVLLRDGVPVLPCGLRYADVVPERLGTVLEPRIAVLNLDGQLVTQTVLVWEGAPLRRPASARHSVVIICTRFARRLQAALMSLAHQHGLAEGDLEVIVGYVPGIDATDDVLDSIQARFPTLTLQRIPFAPDRVRSKGFLINECVSLASGGWITLLDADILLPPDYFSRLDALPDASVFAAPDGRHLLSPKTTAAVLLGEIQPWNDYNALQLQATEYRHRESEGYPPGFCQSFRRPVFDQVRYAELDHFEGSDWLFSKCIVDQYGPETRLDGVGVLHLDHGGSQWYGTGKQR